MEKILEALARIDERMAHFGRGQDQLNGKLDSIENHVHGLSARVTVLEAKDDEVDRLRDRLHSLANTVQAVELKLQSIGEATIRHTSMWEKVTAKWFEIIVTIGMAYMMIKLGLNP